MKARRKSEVPFMGGHGEPNAFKEDNKRKESSWVDDVVGLNCIRVAGTAPVGTNEQQDTTPPHTSSSAYK
jgi:hypothetical protein